MSTEFLNKTTENFQFLSLRSRFIGRSKLNFIFKLNFRLLRHFIPRNGNSVIIFEKSLIITFRNNHPENLQSFFCMMMAMMYMSDLMRDGIT